MGQSKRRTSGKAPGQRAILIQPTVGKQLQPSLQLGKPRGAADLAAAAVAAAVRAAIDTAAIDTAAFDTAAINTAAFCRKEIGRAGLHPFAKAGDSTIPRKRPADSLQT